MGLGRRADPGGADLGDQPVEDRGPLGPDRRRRPPAADRAGGYRLCGHGPSLPVPARAAVRRAVRHWQDDRMGPLMLLDSASLYFRAFYGVPETLTAPDGTPVNAVRGLLDMIARLVRAR